MGGAGFSPSRRRLFTSIDGMRPSAQWRKRWHTYDRSLEKPMHFAVRIKQGWILRESRRSWMSTIMRRGVPTHCQPPRLQAPSSRSYR